MVNKSQSHIINNKYIIALLKYESRFTNLYFRNIETKSMGFQSMQMVLYNISKKMTHFDIDKILFFHLFVEQTAKFFYSFNKNPKNCFKT